MGVVKKLRECAQNPSAGWMRNLENTFGLHRDRCGGVSHKPDGEEILNAIADEIEREIAELQESWAQEAREHADDSAKLAELAHENAELKREIAERYTELPLDADGVTWLLTDEKFISPHGDVYEIKSLDFTDGQWEIVNKSGYVYAANTCRHVKPDPVIELLKEYEHECYMIRVEASETGAADDSVRKAFERTLNEFTNKIRQAVES